jgi:hypothetical protein
MAGSNSVRAPVRLEGSLLIFSTIPSNPHSALPTGTLNINNEAISFPAIATVFIENQAT